MKGIGVWMKGLAAAVVGGALASAAQVVASGNYQPSQLKGAAISGAILTLGAYFAKSPLENKN